MQYTNRRRFSYQCTLQKGKKIGSGAGVLPLEHRPPMPSVGMRRTTRVFGARVLRSGRRLWTQVEGKHLRAGNGEKLIGILENGGVRGGAEVPQCKENGWHENDAFSKQQVTKMEVDSNLESREVEPELERHAGEAVNENANVGRRWGAVYRRKRKYMVEGYDSQNKALEDRRFGKHFVRKQWKKKARYSPKDSPDLPGSVALSVVIHSSYSSGRSIYCLLNSLLGCLRRSMVNLEQFFAFICSKPICDVFSSHGIHFLKVNCFRCFCLSSVSMFLSSKFSNILPCFGSLVGMYS